MEANSLSQYAAHIGLDWADKKHDVCLMFNEKSQMEYDQFEHTPQAIDDWVLTLRKRIPNQRVAICLELKNGPIVYALRKYPFIDLYPIPPATLAKYRETFTHSGAKDDPTDAFLMVDFMRRHDDKLMLIRPDNEQTRILERFVRQRRLLVHDKVRLTNRVTRALKDYYPQVLEWFNEIDSVVFCDFVKQWPNLSKAKRAHKTTLVDFFHAHHVRQTSIIDKRVNAIKTAMALTEDKAVIEPSQYYVLYLIDMLKVLLLSIKQYNKHIAEQFEAHSDYDLFHSFPGAGPVYGPRLLVAMGSQRERFQSSDELVRQAGIAPVIKRSGESTWIHWRYCCPIFVRQTFVEWANQSIHYSYWAKVYYEKQKAKGKGHQTILRALAYKWARILFRCWKNHEPYNEIKYMLSLKKKNSPLVS